METKILPELLEKKQVLKIWSAACSNGSEPYSLAILLEELTPGVKHQIEATDIDKKILEVAKKGYYEERFLKNVSPARLKKFFKPQDKGYAIADELRRRVRYRHHDLLNDPYGRNYDLIVCRNVTQSISPWRLKSFCTGNLVKLWLPAGTCLSELLKTCSGIEN